MLNNILVIGANGKVGRLIIKDLVDRGKRVRGMVRSPDQVKEIERSGAEAFIGDLEKEFTRAFEGMECVIFTAGSGSHTGPDKTVLVDQQGAIKSIDISGDYDIKRYIMVSALGAKNPELRSNIRHYYKAKRKADDYLTDSGLEYTIFRPGRLTDEEGTGKIKVSGQLTVKRTTRRADLALAIAESVDLTQTVNKIIEILDGEDDVADALSSIT
ncbi:MAG: SDR family oxidoreductase [Bacteroidales bacterium]|jgi:uncharacterized protein YbjT (DUF2867 family)